MDYNDNTYNDNDDNIKIMAQTEILETLLSIKEISVFAVMSAVIWFLILDRNSLKDDLKDKDNKIMEVIKTNQEVLKESKNDLITMSEKWTVVFAQLKDIIKDKK